MLRLQAHADEASCEVFEAGNAGDESHVPGESDWVGIAEYAIQNSMDEDLKTLSSSYCGFAVSLHLH